MVPVFCLSNQNLIKSMLCAIYGLIYKTWTCPLLELGDLRILVLRQNVFLMFLVILDRRRPLPSVSLYYS